VNEEARRTRDVLFHSRALTELRGYPLIGMKNTCKRNPVARAVRSPPGLRWAPVPMPRRRHCSLMTWCMKPKGEGSAAGGLVE
jgi:hypothetical protein